MTGGRARLNCSSELAALVAGGRLFQARAAATGNARSPMVERRVDGTCSVIVSMQEAPGIHTDIDYRLTVRSPARTVV